MPIERRFEATLEKDKEKLDGGLNDRLRNLMDAKTSVDAHLSPEARLEDLEVHDDLLMNAPSSSPLSIDDKLRDLMDSKTGSRGALVADDVKGMVVRTQGSKIQLDVILSEDCDASQYAKFGHKTAGGVLQGLGADVTGKMATLAGRQAKGDASEASQLLGKAAEELANKGHYTAQTGVKLLDKLSVNLHVGKPSTMNR